MAAATRPSYFRPEWIQTSDETLHVDVCVYGGTAGGVIAAVNAARQGLSAVVLQPGLFIGGMTTGGLGWTDFGRKYVIGGMSRNFYERVGRHYGKDEEWQFEPHVATDVLTGLLKDAGVAVRFAQFLDRVEKDGPRITAVHMRGGLRVKAKVFMDTTYEGDLLAKAGVSFFVGREDNSVYGESLNGIQVRDKHQFSHRVDPYVKEGDPASGLLPYVEAEDLRQHEGKGDRRVQAYNFRVCMTDDPSLKVDWFQPEGYDASQYELALRWFRSEKDTYNEQLTSKPHGSVGKPVPMKFDVFPNCTPGGFHKTDTNNHGPMSSDFIGANWAWPEADYETREKLFQLHVSYQQGLYWFLANDERVPQRYRDAYSHWGLPRDEFTETGHWPHQLYVREARRMVSDYVVTEADCYEKVRAEDSVGMGSYNIDSHNCTRFVAMKDGKPWVLNDGDVQVPPTDPYPISMRAIVPRAGECTNLIVPTCLSSSHIAYGSARMEPVFMVLGESAAYIAKLAIEADSAVQDVPYAKLRPLLEGAGQVLTLAMARR